MSCCSFRDFTILELYALFVVSIVLVASSCESGSLPELRNRVSNLNNQKCRLCGWAELLGMRRLITSPFLARRKRSDLPPNCFTYRAPSFLGPASGRVRAANCPSTVWMGRFEAVVDISWCLAVHTAQCNALAGLLPQALYKCYRRPFCISNL